VLARTQKKRALGHAPFLEAIIQCAGDRSSGSPFSPAPSHPPCGGQWLRAGSFQAYSFRKSPGFAPGSLLTPLVTTEIISAAKVGRYGDLVWWEKFLVQGIGYWVPSTADRLATASAICNCRLFSAPLAAEGMLRVKKLREPLCLRASVV